MLADAQQMDWNMHDRMIDALNNELISSIYRTNSIKLRVIRNDDTRMLPELVVSVMDEHLVLIDALISRDEGRVRLALDAHLNSAKQRVLQL